MSIGRSECDSCRIVIEPEEDCFCPDCYKDLDEKVDGLDQEIEELNNRIADLEKQLEEG